MLPWMVNICLIFPCFIVNALRRSITQQSVHPKKTSHQQEIRPSDMLPQNVQIEQINQHPNKQSYSQVPTSSISENSKQKLPVEVLSDPNEIGHQVDQKLEELQSERKDNQLQDSQLVQVLKQKKLAPLHQVPQMPLNSQQQEYKAIDISKDHAQIQGEFNNCENHNQIDQSDDSIHQLEQTQSIQNECSAQTQPEFKNNVSKLKINEILLWISYSMFFQACISRVYIDNIADTVTFPEVLILVLINIILQCTIYNFYNLIMDIVSSKAYRPNITISLLIYNCLITIPIYYGEDGRMDYDNIAWLITCVIGLGIQLIIDRKLINPLFKLY